MVLFTGKDHIFNVVIYSWPKSLFVHCSRDHQAEAIHNEAIIEGKVAVDIPVAPALLWELVSMFWKSINDVML